MSKILKPVLLIATIIFVCVVSYAAWQLGRIINYKMSYKDMVVETIKETVKENCLLNN
jgi:hypothetical protein